VANHPQCVPSKFGASVEIAQRISYMPFIMGYMMGNMMRSGAATYAGRPL
jgi:uncharacterized protein YgiB involved in biofilm formation